MCLLVKRHVNCCSKPWNQGCEHWSWKECQRCEHKEAGFLSIRRNGSVWLYEGSLCSTCTLKQFYLSVLYSLTHPPPPPPHTHTHTYTYFHKRDFGLQSQMEIIDVVQNHQRVLGPFGSDVTVMVDWALKEKSCFLSSQCTETGH